MVHPIIISDFGKSAIAKFLGSARSRSVLFEIASPNGKTRVVLTKEERIALKFQQEVLIHLYNLESPITLHDLLGVAIPPLYLG
ncbi:MAG: hypothetical protein QNJ18_15885 [Xenococcaceae cyanobacterium MO_167.B52]|nr:hypothetical protein [Xenococcaceae cyanobacterium MO_167.B52]